MTFEQLTYFLEAAETLNFSKAAENLYIHNTTICRGIANLEAEFGAPLFIRGKNTLILTELGEKLKTDGSLLAQHYRDVLQSIDFNLTVVNSYPVRKLNLQVILNSFYH